MFIRRTLIKYIILFFSQQKDISPGHFPGYRHGKF